MIDRSLNYGRHLIERYLRLSLPFRSVLDIGAGQGHDLLSAKRLVPDAVLFAVETCPDFLPALRQNGIGVSATDIEKERLPFENGALDVVVANQVLEHVKEVFWIFHEISRVLRTGGKVIIGVPNLASLHNRILLLFGRQPTQIRTASAHVRGLTKGDLIGFFEAAFPEGYRLIASGGSNFYPFPPFLAKPLAGLFPGAAWGMFLLLEKQKEYTQEFLDFPTALRLETNFYLGRQ